MALEWIVLGYTAAAEAIILLMLTMPGLDRLGKGLNAVARNALKPLLTVVPFCVFLLMDIYWKFEVRPVCDGPLCSPAEHLRHQKSVMKSQRNALLIVMSLVLYWLLYRVTILRLQLQRMDEQLQRLKNKD